MQPMQAKINETGVINRQAAQKETRHGKWMQPLRRQTGDYLKS